ncbi:MAG: DTW domain-containing protein [Deltaproteobacteria bacterium]|nr:DTW domain-containing protein [Deltaproteobacteria bacterium]
MTSPSSPTSDSAAVDDRCARCLLRACLCAGVPVVAARTRVVIVRHPAERHRSSNSGRLAHLALTNSVLVEYRAPMPELDGAWLLYPEGPPCLAAPEPPPRQLVVLDGTWSQARRMFRKLAPLRGLPILRLPEGARAPRMREAPSPDRVSTIEAIARALRVLEGDGVATPLEELFALAVARAAASGRTIAAGPAAPVT